jgi:hypothetical protein
MDTNSFYKENEHNQKEKSYLEEEKINGEVNLEEEFISSLE